MEKKLLTQMIESSKSEGNLGTKKNPSDESDHPIHTTFVRVWKVRIVHGKFITCSCGYCQRLLAPCPHVMAVLSTSEFILPSLFHVRWFKHFNYYFGDEFGSETMKHMHKSMVDLYNRCHKEGYDSNGKYYGCNIAGNPFLNLKHAEDMSSDNRIMMDAIEKHTFEIGPLTKNSDRYLMYLPWVNYNKDTDDGFYNVRFICPPSKL